MTEHERLVRKARRFLLRDHPLVVSELVSGRETPDVIGFQHSGHSTLIEVKVSRSDFLRDKEKFGRRPELAWRGAGSGLGDKRYYLIPQGLLERSDLPKGWGLLTLLPRGGIGLHAESVNFNKDWRAEMGLLLSLIRRIRPSSCPEHVSLKFYRWQTKNQAVAIVDGRDDVDMASVKVNRGD